MDNTYLTHTRIKVGAVSYLNTRPLLYGIERLPIREHLHLTSHYPAEVARQLLQQEIDMGLVPVAILAQMPQYWIEADYCIGANGPVATVGIYSDVPLQQVDTLYLDYQSRTSVALAQVLLKHHWQLSPQLLPAYPGFEKDIKGRTAGLVIGDRAFVQKKQNKYEYDLAEAWKKMTGLPFVFAAWVANKPLPDDFVDAFNRANAWGLSRLPEVIAAMPPSPHDLLTYYTRHISYQLNEEKRAGMQHFLQLMAGLKQPVAA